MVFSLSAARHGGGGAHYAIRISASSSCVQESRRAHFSSCVKRRRRISFLTDVEGDKRYFDRFVDNSKILTFEQTARSIDDPTSQQYFPYDRHVVFTESECNSDDRPEEHKSALIYGGDVCDKGGSDLYVLRQLLSLHRRHPKRVHLIMGNRDINKMRILPEMGLGEDGDGDGDGDGDSNELPHHGGCWWLEGTGLEGDPTASPSVKARTGKRDSGSSVNKLSKVPSKTPAQRLKWILGKTMGSPDAFEFRRQELQREYECINNVTRSITDEEVVASYRRACHPCGEMGRYLASAKLLVKLGRIVFMHGALPRPEIVPSHQKQSLWSSVDYAMPWITDPQEEVESVESWVECLNTFAHEQVLLWRKSIENFDSSIGVWSTVGGYNETKFPYGNLLQFGMGWLPSREKNPTIVYSSWLKDGMPRHFYKMSENVRANKVASDMSDDVATSYANEVSKFFGLAQPKLQLIVSGHQPHGDHPTPIRLNPHCLSDKSRFIIPCDTSYSGDTHWVCSGSGEKKMNKGRGKSLSGRGDVAVTELLIDQCVADGSVNSAIMHGSLSDGSKYETVNLFENADKDSDVALIGTRLDRKDFIFEGSVRDDTIDEEDWWIKSKLKNGKFLVSSGKGYEVFNSIATRRR